MIIECPTCLARYKYDEERFERKPSKKIKCAKCKQVFEIQNPAYAAPASTDAQDDTAMRRAQPTPAAVQTPVDSDADRAPARSENLQMPTGRRLSLAIIDGPDAGSVFRIEKPRVTIGRSGADLTLNDTETSRNHAAVEVRDAVYTLVDLGSTNGTIVNGEKIAAPIELQNHSEFQVGASTLMLIITEE